MRRENALQRWCVDHVKKGTLVAAIGDGTGTDGCRDEWTPPPEAGLDLGHKITSRVLANTRRIHTALLDAGLVAAGAPEL